MKVVSAGQIDRVDALCRAGTFFWLDLLDPSQEEIERLGEELSLHPLALEDTREWQQRPKLDTYEDHLFLVFYAARVDGEHFRPVEVHLFLSGSWVITAHRDPCPPLAALAGAGEPPESEAATVYRILDALTDSYEPVISEIEEYVDALELEIFERARQGQLERIYRLKQEVHGIARRVIAQRDTFAATQAAVMDLPGLEQGGDAYLRDVGDHLLQAAGELSRQGADLQALTDTFFNANTTRLNAQATRLSVIATFFLSWTLVTGFFGQNFGWLVDGIDTRTDFLVFGVGALGIPTVALSVYFWRRRSDWQ